MHQKHYQLHSLQKTQLILYTHTHQRHYRRFSSLAHDHHHRSLVFVRAVTVEAFSAFILQQYPVVFRRQTTWHSVCS